jgi:hypothetical protein
MLGKIAEPASEDADGGCAFILDGGAAGLRVCRVPCRPGSPYCREHHALCHLPPGSTAERRQLREIEALADAVGGRQGRPARSPPAALLRRLTRLERIFSGPRCSRIVRKGGKDAEQRKRRWNDGCRPCGGRLRTDP